MRQNDEAREKKFALTARELQIVSAVVDGRSNREIAHDLSIAEDTVKHHLSNIFDKLGVHTRLELARFAIKRSERSSDDSDFGDPRPLAGNLPALVVSVLMLSILGAIAYGGLLLLRLLLNGACKVLHCG